MNQIYGCSFMNIVPKRKVVLKTELTKEEILKRLNECHGYKVSINNDTFRMHRIRYRDYRNICLYQIKGNIYDDYNITKVETTMQVYTGLLIFMMIWFVCFIFFCREVVINIFSSEIHYLAPFALVIFVVLLVPISHLIECKKTEKGLRRILDAEVIAKYWSITSKH